MYNNNNIKKQMDNKRKKDKEVELTASGLEKTRIKVKTNEPKRDIHAEDQARVDSIKSENEYNPNFNSAKESSEDYIDHEKRIRNEAGDRPYNGKSDWWIIIFIIVAVMIEFPINLDVFQNLESVYTQWVTTIGIGLVLSIFSHKVGVFAKQYNSIRLYDAQRMTSEIIFTTMFALLVLGALVYLFHARVEYILYLAGITDGVFSSKGLDMIASTSIISEVLGMTWVNFFIVAGGSYIGYWSSDKHYEYKDAIKNKTSSLNRYYKFIFNTNEKLKAYTR